MPWVRQNLRSRKQSRQPADQNYNASNEPTMGHSNDLELSQVPSTSMSVFRTTGSIISSRDLSIPQNTA
jgi:hypothetical protein